MKFYEKAFAFSRKFIAPDNSYRVMLTVDTTLSSASVALANSNHAKGFIESNLTEITFGFEISFTTENVEETLQNAIDAGVKITSDTQN